MSFENLRTKRSIYIYELDRMFDSAEEVSKILDLNADDVTESLIYRKGEIAGLHLAWGDHIYPHHWRKVRVVESGKIFLSDYHAAYHFHVTYSSIRNAIKLRNGKFRNVHLEYVKE